MAEEIRAGGKARRDGDIPLGAALAEEVRSPRLTAGARVVGELSNLDPRWTRVALEGGAVIVGASSNVVHDGAAVGAVPLVPEEGPAVSVREGDGGQDSVGVLHCISGIDVDGSLSRLIAAIVATIDGCE